MRRRILFLAATLGMVALLAMGAPAYGQGRPFSTTLTVTLLGLGLSAAEEWQALAWRELAMLAAAAVLVSLGNMAIVRAFRTGEMSVVSPFRYSIVLTSLLAGLLVFGEWPDGVAALGIALIVLSGVYTIRREQARHRDEVRACAAGEAA